MAEIYDHRRLEKKWQEEWEKARLYETPDDLAGKENFYALVEYPYPSGDLHVGHWYAFSVPDIFARYKRMQGYNVLYPIGFDAFGLPAENAAIKHKIDPAKWTWENIQRMRTQLRSMGAMFDWSREAVACDSSYYKWTQWLFLKFFEKGLAYRGKALVNWDPVDMTVLANEQVLPDGTAERSGAKVEKRELEQWFIRITEYADRLLEDLGPLPWPEPIKEAQRNWIGKSDGLIFSSPVKDSDLVVETFSAHFEAFTADTFVVIAPDHPLLPQLLEGVPGASDILAAAQEMAAKRRHAGYVAEKEVEGIFTGRYTVDPVGNGELPIWIASYALADYGTGIVKCSAHDERDFVFAKKYGIPLKVTLVPEDPALRKRVEAKEVCYSDMDNGMLLEPRPFAMRKAALARNEIIAYAESKHLAKKTTTYKLHDWLVSRQRYWGAPIPVVYDPQGKAHAIPEEHLPWTLPTDIDFTPTGTAPLARSKELIDRTERTFGKGWRPETDTLDTFVDSSWYFLRYLDPKNTAEFSAIEKQKKWMPVARYSGGAEHTTMHLLYSRFFYKALYDMGLVTELEPYSSRMNRGIILAEDGRKMSKRWGNVVNPDEQVANVGADAVRTYLAFIGPYNEVGSYPWNTNGLIGVRRFLERVAGLAHRASSSESVSERLSILMNQTIKKVGEDIESMKFNTSVSALMIFANELQKMSAVPSEAYSLLIRLLAPFAPHLAEELWHSTGNEGSVHTAPWPAFNASKLEADAVTIGVQIAGKTRGSLTVSRNATEKEALLAAQGDSRLAALIPQSPRRVVYVPGKILNVVP
ncbi:MAG: leucine--tRNA ligase [Patescibacteria group bacterium]|nr:leucine--tRNA ligase [Patescibacteria group bacterium]